jgi:hypothetical protein
LSEDFDGTKASDRRIATRRQSGAHVWADPGGVMPAIDCRIIDISETGAKIATVTGQPLPDRFQLQIEPTRVLGEAEVVWRNGRAAGVRIR